MVNSYQFFFEAAAAFSLIFVVVLLYRDLLSWGAKLRIRDSAAGLAFGIATAGQIYNPYMPFEGLIIDLRAVPLVLAGAYFGWRGVLICAAIGLAARIDVGGVGVWAGSAAVILALAQGVIWARILRRFTRRGTVQLVLLGCLSPVHLSTFLILPAPEQQWFAQNALLPLLLLNLILLPIFAAFIEQQRWSIGERKKLRALARSQDTHGLLNIHAFRQELETRSTASSDLHVRKVLLVRIRHLHWMEVWTDRSEVNRMLGAMRVRIEQAVPGIPPIGVVAPGTLLVPLKLQHVLEWDAVIATIRRSLTETPFKAGQMQSYGVNLDIEMVKPESIFDPELQTRINSRLDQPFRVRRHPSENGTSRARTEGAKKPATGMISMPSGECDRVFSKLGLLMQDNMQR